MVIGQHFVKVGEKNRIAFPKKMRSQMGDDLIITRGFEKAILVFSKEKWEEVVGEIDNESFLKQEARTVKRFLLGGASEVECDTQGRFVLPEYLIEFGQINDEVVVIGMGKYVEIWDKNAWNKEQKENVEQVASAAQSLVEKMHE